MARADGLRRLPEEVAAALVQALAALPEPARDERLLLRPAGWVHPSEEHERDKFYVFCRGERVGFIKHSRWYVGEDTPWIWNLDVANAPDQKAATREQAMADFRRAWNAERRSGNAPDAG